MFANLLEKSVDQVLSAFRKTISDLEEVASAQSEKAANYEAEALRVMDASNAAKAEAERAELISTKLKTIFEA